MSQTLVVFAKYWDVGQVKTRLAATLGNQVARDVYRAFVESVVARFAGEADERIVYYSPPDAESDFASYLAGRHWQHLPQCEGNLGQRLSACVQECLTTADSVVILGTDSPNLPVSWLRQAFTMLRHHDVVLGPSLDGGYYLVGMTAPFIALFERIDWSTINVLHQTRQRIAEQQPELSYGELPMWYDVDNAGDLERLVSDLDTEIASTLSPPASLRRLMGRLQPHLR